MQQAYWNDLAASYDDYPDHGLADPATHEAWRRLLVSALPEQPCRIVEFACGTGSMSVLAAAAGHHVHASDYAPNMVTAARAKVHEHGLDDRVEVIEADASEPPYPEAGFDVVLARHVVWALPDPVAALRRWAALLRPGGRMVLIEGRWGLEPADDGHRWSNGVPSADLVAELEADGWTVSLRPLWEPVYWGKQIEHERYLVSAVRPEGGRVDRQNEQGAGADLRSPDPRPTR